MFCRYRHIQDDREGIETHKPFQNLTRQGINTQGVLSVHKIHVPHKRLDITTSQQPMTKDVKENYSYRDQIICMFSMLHHDQT